MNFSVSLRIIPFHSIFYVKNPAAETAGCKIYKINPLVKGGSICILKRKRVRIIHEF